MTNRGARWRRGRRLGPCWCGRAGHALVYAMSPDGTIEFDGLPACADHQFPERWPAEVWDGIRDAVRWEHSPAWDVDSCPLCALPHGPLASCEAFRATVDATWPWRAPDASLVN